MVALSEPDAGTHALIEIIELKWLLAGRGVHLHVEKLQSDVEYAKQTLAAAEASGSTALRQAVGKLRLKLGLCPG